MTTAAFVHSVLGTRRLIAPLLQMREGVLSDPLVRNILRFAWHATSVLMLVSAAAVAWPGTPKPLIAVLGGFWLATGLLTAAYPWGRHIPWPVLSDTGPSAPTGAGGG